MSRESHCQTHAIQLRHPNIAEDHIGRGALDVRPCIFPIMGTMHVVPGLRKQIAENVAQLAIIFHDKH